MKEVERQRVKKALEYVYGLWHQCHLEKAERGIPKGTLCDSCQEEIRAHLKDICTP